MYSIICFIVSSLIYGVSAQMLQNRLGEAWKIPRMFEWYAQYHTLHTSILAVSFLASWCSIFWVIVDLIMFFVKG